MRLFCSLLILLGISRVSFSQDRILTKTGELIPCRLESVSSQLVRYINSTNNHRDSIHTLDLRKLQYADSLQVFVQPASERGRVWTVPFTDIANAIQSNTYTTLFHSKAIRHDLAFANGQATLTPDGSRQAIRLAALLKTRPQLRISLTVHTDTLGTAIANKTLSDRRASTLRTLLIANGVLAKNLIVQGLGESQVAIGAGMSNRRVELKVDAIDRVIELYGEAYTPPRHPAPKPTDNPEPTSATITKPTPPAAFVAAKPNKIGVVLYGEGVYALATQSKTWVDPDQGVGILQGFGWGLLLNYYLTPRFGLSFQGGYATWKVQRRYKTDAGDVVFTNDEALKRIIAQIGFRVYALRSVYLQPMGGGQFLTLTSQNSDTHPDGPVKTETKKFMPTFGGSLGFELGKGGVVADIAAQYQVTPNTDFAKATGPLHYAGLRLGIGFRPRAH